MSQKIEGARPARTAAPRQAKTSATVQKRAPEKKTPKATGAAVPRTLRWPPPGVDIKPNAWRRMPVEQRREIWKSAHGGKPAAPRTPTAPPAAPAKPDAPAAPTSKAQPAGAMGDLLGLAPGTTKKVEIKKLQDALMALGYLEDVRQNAGYGKNFGPKTEAALKKLQSENGLTPTGVVDVATVGALEHPRPRPAGFATGIAVTCQDRLGLPKTPPYRAPDGSLRQDFDRGSVWIGPDRVRHVQVQGPRGPIDVVAPRKLGTAQTVEEANASFLTQWGPTATNDPPAGSDVPWGYYDCGPTCGVMALATLGIAGKPGAGEAHRAIDQMRDRILGFDSKKSLGLSLGPSTAKGTVAYGLAAAGATCTMLGKDGLDAALDRGNPVIIGSSATYAAWGRDQKLAGNYLNGGDPKGHFVIVLGRAANGNYLVGDPLVKGGVMEVTPKQMETCLGGAWSSNSLLEVSAPS